MDGLTDYLSDSECPLPIADGMCLASLPFQGLGID